MNIFDYGIKALQEDPKVSAEEVRRATVADNAANRVTHFIADLSELAAKDLRNADTLKALITTGAKILELGLHTKGRLKAAEGRSDAFLEATAANVKSAFRNAVSVMDECDLDLGAWSEALEISKPAIDDLTRISKALERPGVKTAVTPAIPEKPKPDPGPRLLEDDGQPAPEAEVPEPTPMPCKAVQTIGYTPAPESEAIDAEVVEPHPLEGLTDEAQDLAFRNLLNQLEEAGVESGNKRKAWKPVEAAWLDAWKEADDFETTCEVFDKLTWALSIPTWQPIPTVEEWQSILAADADEPSNVAPLDRAAGEE